LKPRNPREAIPPKTPETPEFHIAGDMNVDTIPDFLAEQRDSAPEELQPLVLEFETLWERKLWHQLTNQLIEFFNHPGSAPQRLQFYKVFVLKFADKINQLKLVDLALKAATQCRGRRRR
jgi:26S proteasome regulatory subunit N9